MIWWFIEEPGGSFSTPPRILRNIGDNRLKEKPRKRFFEIPNVDLLGN